MTNSLYDYFGEYLFIKLLYSHNYLTYFIFYDGFYGIYIFLFELNYKDSTSQISPKISKNYYHNEKYFYLDESLNDFVKLDDNRLVYIFIGYVYKYYNPGCLKRILEPLVGKGKELGILLINIDENTRNIIINDYYINFETFLPTNQISVFLYNNYLLIGASVLFQKYTYQFEDLSDYLSMFMILGYAEGTDNIIDISEYFYNQNSGENINFFEFLYKNFTIKNNIFDFIPIKSIRFTFIPNEIKIFIHYLENGLRERNIEEEEEKENKILIQTPYILCSSSEEREFCDNNFGVEYELIFEQNKSLIKNSQYYYIDYQYIIDDIYYFYIFEEGYDLNYLEPKIYYGRTNRLKFKLCHDYCETCYELGISKDDQKCQTCLPEYQYDYLYLSNRAEENPNICVPEGYYYNTNERKLYLCDSTENFFYINTTNNKKICFKKNIINNVHFLIQLIKK